MRFFLKMRGRISNPLSPCGRGLVRICPEWIHSEIHRRRRVTLPLPLPSREGKSKEFCRVGPPLADAYGSLKALTWFT